MIERVHAASGLARRHQNLQQRGMALLSLCFVLGMIIAAVIVVAKCVPAWNEFMAVKRAMVNIETSGESNVSAARKAFDRFAEIDRIESLTGADITFRPVDGGLKGEYEYESRVDLFGNASLVFTFRN